MASHTEDPLARPHRLRGYEIVAKPRRSLALGLRDPNDEWIIASAFQASADIVVSGDHNLLDVARRLPVRTVSPRECWELIRGGRL